MNCQICKNPVETKGFYQALRERLEKQHICFTCDTWLSHWQNRNDENVIRVAGNHWMAVDDGSGIEMTIRKDGKLMTVNAWHQGKIPSTFVNALPDNAEYARRIEVAYAA